MAPCPAAAGVTIAVSNAPWTCTKGATVEWDVDLFNDGGQAEIVDVWLKIEGGSRPFTYMIAQDVEISAYGSVHIDVSLYVIQKAQRITYTVNNLAGKFPAEVYDSAEFDCRVSYGMKGKPHKP
jgi:hypothetical protein